MEEIAVKYKPIIIADDEALIRELYMRFAKNGGNLGNTEIYQAESVDEMMAFYGSMNPGLIISDNTMGPGKKGIDALAAIRKTDRGIMLCLFSGDAKPDADRNAAIAENNDIIYAAKPVERIFIVGVIGAYMERPNSRF